MVVLKKKILHHPLEHSVQFSPLDFVEDLVKLWQMGESQYQGNGAAASSAFQSEGGVRDMTEVHKFM